MKPKVLVFAGYGLNSEEETAFGFNWAGAKAEVAHINDVIDGHFKLKDYQMLAFPGGFAYADDTGSGNAYANKLRNHLWEKIKQFIEKDKLVIGICNGCQIVSNLGLVPAFDKKYGERQVALLHNQSARLVTRWLDMKVTAKTPWLNGIDTLSLPIAHGEGKFFATDETLKKLHDNKQIALQYIKGEMSTYLDVPANPNGSIDDIAGIIDETGKIFALMPHPERGMFFTQLPNWPLLKQQSTKELPKEGPGLKIFKNAVEYFK
ncbi:phosphoribosylformylglycinamidine synthase subunit PurQ [Candidatus Roizmanbacteria bacterium]|nr:phosphoribosylformylglycinamidine synthase subunit PurQ [Candidatus Roizmanbacteria bacterium]